MKNCAILTMDNLRDLSCYDNLTYAPLNQLGWGVHEISWRDRQVNWNDFDAVIIRSPWDYQNSPSEFLAVLNDIENSSALLANSLDVVNWNLNKKYLAQLEQKGVTIVPTIWNDQFSQNLLSQAFNLLQTNELILKPAISANADDTFRLNKSEAIDTANLQQLFAKRDFMIQPFMSSIIDEGEYSLFYFNSKYSHSILKRPNSGDFRVQEDHGGRLLKIEPEKTLSDTAESALSAIPFQTLYARLDFVRFGDKFAMMEAELIEPSLYFNMDEYSAARFAKAFDDFYQQRAA